MPYEDEGVEIGMARVVRELGTRSDDTYRPKHAREMPNQPRDYEPPTQLDRIEQFRAMINAMFYGELVRIGTELDTVYVESMDTAAWLHKWANTDLSQTASQTNAKATTD